MKYAIILEGRVNLISCDAAFAADHPEVVEVPDDVHSGWVDNGDGTYSEPREPEIRGVNAGALMDVMAISELIAFYELAKTDTRAEILKDFILRRRIISKDRASSILAYLVTKGVVTEARRVEIINKAKRAL